MTGVSENTYPIPLQWTCSRLGRLWWHFTVRCHLVWYTGQQLR